MVPPLESQCIRLEEPVLALDGTANLCARKIWDPAQRTEQVATKNNTLITETRILLDDLPPKSKFKVNKAPALPDHKQNIIFQILAVHLIDQLTIHDSRHIRHATNIVHVLNLLLTLSLPGFMFVSTF